MPAEPIVSIIIPCYNSGEFLSKAVESALGQTYSHIECVIVDDGSTDENTLAELAKLEGRQRVTMIHTANRKVPAALNTGIAASVGKYYIPLGADDVILPTFAERSLPLMEGDPTIGFVYSEVDFIINGRRQHWSLPEFRWGRLLLQNTFVATALFRKSDWESVGGYDERHLIGKEDHEFAVRLLGSGLRPVQVHEVLFLYRQHGVSRKNSTIDDRDNLISMTVQRFRNNLGVYSDHADDFFRYLFEIVDERNDLRHRYHQFERLRLRFPKVIDQIRRVRAGARAATRG